MGKSKASGRPSIYKPEYHPEQARKLTLLGLTIEELADVFQVNQETVHDWMRKHPEFSEAIHRGRTVADAEVAASLYQRAVGYEYQKAQAFVDRFGEEHVVVYTEKLHPDVGAAKSWLANRQRGRWTERQEVAHDVTGTAADLAGKGQSPFAIVQINGQPFGVGPINQEPSDEQAP